MTQFYVGVKIIEAWPSEKEGMDGYAVKYQDGYQSWSPKQEFERAYYPMGETNDNKVTPDMVDAFLENKSVIDLDEKTTLVKATLLTGFSQYEVSSCVDTKNYDPEIGCEIATKRIKDTIWKCLGFVVQWGRYGLKKNQEKKLTNA